MPQLVVPISVGLATTGVEKVARGKSLKAAGTRGVVAGASTWGTNELFMMMPQARSIFLLPSY